MTCTGCGWVNTPGSRFCSGCGAVLAPRCEACGAENAVGARFCNGCGAAFGAAPIARPAADAVSRKIVTIVFADLIGSVSLHERLDAESARRLMDRYHRAMSAAVDVHGGRVVQLLGDGVLAAFGVPRVAEDDAIRAVRAAVGMQRTFRELAREQGAAMEGVGLRVAVNTGEIVVSDDENSVMGDPTNVAARLQQEARDGDVIVGEGTQRLVRELVTLAPLGTFALRGRAETVAAYRVVSLDRPASQQAIAFVGRDEELRRLTAVYDAAVAAPAARLAVLLGSPGLGKSRLVAEFTRRAGERATVLSARCDAAGGATFAPLAEALRALLRIDEGAGGDVLRAAIDAVVSGDDAERTRIATGIGALLAGTPAPPEETFFVVRRLLAALAAVRPVVLVIDDLQWAEPLLLDLVEHLVQWSSGVPLLVLVAARPELRDARSALATPGALVADVVTLAGLDASAATRLAANVIGGAELPAALAGRVLATSEGNPLFVSELVRMLVQDGTLQREGDRWITTVEVAKLDMPPTIQVLLAARIERLRPEERSVLERAAVVGRQFSRAAVAHLLGATPELDARLEALRRSELIEPDTGWFLGEPALRFHHVLIRDAAYRRVLKETRAELHARIADWIGSRVGEAIEHDETIGWHLEQAHQHLRELGPLDASGRRLGERAARYLGAAGRRALARDDLPLAAGLLGRAIDRLDRDDGTRADLALDWCEALLAAGDVGPATAALDELGRFCADSSRLRAWHVCFAGQLAVLTDPQALRTTADAVAAAAEELIALGDAAGEAKAHFVHAMALVRLGKVGACEAALDRALAAARRARDRRRANAVLAGAPVAALWGPSPVTRASGRCLDVVRVLRITQGAPAVEAVALRCQGVLEALRGRTDAARRMIASSRRLVEELGITQRLLEADVFAGHVELIEGDAEAAERWLRTAYDGLRDLGLGIDAAQAGALLGRALLAQDRAAEAEALSHESEALAGDDLKAAITWRGVRAEALARRGEHAAAIEFARAAVEIAAATDDLLDHADARQALAVALRAAGRGPEADAEETRAIELWEAKGATLLVERARQGATQAGSATLEDAASTVPSRTVRRRVAPNAATRNAARLDAAFRSGDAAAVSGSIGDEVTVVHHPTGAVFGRAGALGRFQALLRAENPILQHEPIATLGESLALCRQFTSVDALADDDVAPAGASRTDLIVLIEMGDAGSRRIEVFADDHLADAIARLYERHAELLPDGPERVRAAATARSVGTLLASPDLDAYRTAFAEDVASDDHRTLGWGSTQGREALMRGFRSLFETSSNIAIRVDDVLALESDAVLMRWIVSGTDRVGGGVFERHFLLIWVFGAGGLVARSEQFDAECIGEALARFDALTAPAPARRVRPNASFATGTRLRAAALARDLDAITALIADDFQLLHHPTGALVDREAGLQRWRMLFRAEELQLSWNSLATLGDSLELGHDVTSFAGLAQDELSFGASSSSYFNLCEINERGQAVRIEVFSDEHLGDAIVRLYERYAELLPEGPARNRAATTARCIAALFGDDLEAVIDLSTDDCELRDHRRIGLFEGRGKRGMTRSVRSYREMVEDSALRVDEILGLDASAILVRSLLSGTDRRAGGRVESERIELRCFGADGRQTLAEVFEPDRTADALARFDAITAPRAPTHRVRANAATAHAARMDVAVAARDLDAFLDLLAVDAQAVHHQTGAVYAEREARRAYEMLLGNESLVFGHAPIATLGDSLALCRGNLSIDVSLTEDLPFGASNMDSLVLMEVDASGRRRATEFFALGKLTDAICRLYARHAELEPEGSARERAALTARAVEGVVLLYGADHLRAFPEFVAHDYAFVDHRLLGFESSRGVEGLIAGTRSMLELADDLVVHVEEVFDLRAEGFVARSITSGRHRSSGGPFEREAVQIRTFDAAGRLLHTEWFDTDRVDEALARFDALTAAAPEPRFANAAWRAQLAFEKAWLERRWEDVVASVGPAFALEDRRSIVRLDLAGADFVTNLRMMFAMRESRWQTELLATRGERLTLSRARFSAELSGGAPIEFEHLAVSERGADGRSVALILFDLDARDAAYAELDRRYAAGEGAPHAALLAHWGAFRAATNARDWETARSLLPDDFSMYSHRSLASTGMRMNRDTFITSLGWGDERGVRSVLRREHLRVSAGAAIEAVTLLGNADGGDFEQEFVLVFGHDDSRLRSCEAFDLDQLGPARARFEALSREPAAAARIENAVTRAEHAIQRAWNTRDWDAFAALVPAQFRSIDRRRLMHLELDRDGILAGIRPFFETGVSRSSELLATRGERFALFQVDLRGSDGLTGPSEVEFVQVIETDALGRRISAVAFDPDDLDAAYAELDARYHAGEAAAHPSVAAGMREFSRAFAARDWDALAARCAPEIAVRDHRRLGWETLHGPAAYVHALRTLVDLAPDTALRLDHVEMCAQGYLVVTVWSGTRDGGAFEEPSLMVAELDAAGRILRFDQYETERLAEARARYASIGAPASSDPLRIPPNAATRAGERLYACALTADWDALRDLCAPIFFDDRRPLFRLSGGCELIVANTQAIDRSIWERSTRTLLATAGDRLALHYNQWRGDEAAGAFEVDNLEITEVDAEGRIVAAIVFDPGDRRAAGAEMLDRYARSDVGRLRPATNWELARAIRDHDLDRVRSALPDGFVFHDRRRIGAGRLEGEEYIGWLSALFEQSADAVIELLYVVASEPHGVLSVGHTYGTRNEGGAFESIFAQLAGPFGLELYDIEDLDRARARLEELRPDPLRIPPNAATRAHERLGAAFGARDWAAVRALASPDFAFADRRRRALIEGDIELWIRNLEYVRDMPALQSRPERIGALGDRIALTRIRYGGESAAAGFEGDFIQLIETAPDGLLRAVVHFDPEDRAAAFVEAHRRFAAGEAAGVGGQDPIAALGEAFGNHDWEAVRAGFASDAVMHDQRTLGLGRITVDAWIESLRVFADLAPDLGGEQFQILAWNRHGRVASMRNAGTRDGGAFENVFVGVFLTDGERIRRFELFDLGDADRALARFGALCAERS